MIVCPQFYRRLWGALSSSVNLEARSILRHGRADRAVESARRSIQAIPHNGSFLESAVERTQKFPPARRRELLQALHYFFQ